MDMILTVFGNMLNDSNTIFMALLIFLAAGDAGILANGGRARARCSQEAHRAPYG